MTENQTNQISLIRGLGLIAGISIIIGNVIGTGVFLKARVMTCNLGSPEWVLIAWIAAGILSLAGALTYAELSAMKPEAGGEYAFLRDGFGRLPSFLFGWTQMFIARTGAQAAVAVAFAIGLNDFYGGALKRTLFKTDSFELTSLQLIAVLLIVIFSIINLGSVVLTGRIATVLTFVKIALILFVGLGAFLWVTGGSFANFSLMNDGGKCEGVADSVRVGSASYTFLGGFAAAMLGALWGYDGWNNLAPVAGEVKNPGRNIPLALIGGTILIIILYVFVHLAYFYFLDPTFIASVSKDSSVAKELVARFSDSNLGIFATGLAVSIFTIGLMLSSIGTLHTSIMSAARIPYAMAQDGLMFKPFGKLSEKTRIPVVSVVVQGIWACLLALSGSFDTLTDYVIFGSWIFYALATATIFVFRRKYPNAERPYKAFGYPVVPILFLFVAGWLLFTTMQTDFTKGVGLILEGDYLIGVKDILVSPSFMGIFLILMGLVVYHLLTRQNFISILVVTILIIIALITHIIGEPFLLLRNSSILLMILYLLGLLVYLIFIEIRQGNSKDAGT
jgi:APA family basic amino acid/polyamine antiporter